MICVTYLKYFFNTTGIKQAVPKYEYQACTNMTGIRGPFDIPQLKRSLYFWTEWYWCPTEGRTPVLRYEYDNSYNTVPVRGRNVDRSQLLY